MDKIAIHEFSIKWIEKFKVQNKNSHELFETMDFPNECWTLGIEMDGVKLFSEKYGSESFRELESLQRIIYNVDDIQALGNLIFSKWRWFNHGDYVVYKPEDEKWFIMAFNRLIELTKE